MVAEDQVFDVDSLLRPESFENWLDTHIAHGFEQSSLTRNGLTLSSYLCACHAMFFRTTPAVGEEPGMSTYEDG